MTLSLEAIAQLDHSHDFAKLHQKFTKFNPLKVLRVDQFEIRHSNVLGWLLNPNENHQLGSFFIKKLVSRLVTRLENEEKVEGIDVLSFLHASYSGTEVYREVKTNTNRLIDLLVVIPTLKLVLVIENKFHAAESVGQLEDYLAFANQTYSDYQIIPVFLTLKRDAPSHPDYWILDYNDIYEIIQSHLQLNKEAISDPIFDFLQYYTDILQEELVQDEEAVQLALAVYEGNQAAIDLLFLSQHRDYRKQQRYHQLYKQIEKMPAHQQEGLKRIYEKNKQTIDYVFNIGSNVLREAFLSFVKMEEIPEEVFQAHVSVPNFILPEWVDFVETIGEPEQGYWLGYGLIIWFERTWDERLKINVEVGPIPFEQRLKLLHALENQGISIRSSAKLEGKKYTKIFTSTISITDWANKQEIVTGMEQMYHDTALLSTFKKIACAVESMERGEELLLEQPKKNLVAQIPDGAFQQFAATFQIMAGDYRSQGRMISFLLPEFRSLEESYGTTRIKWWWHNSTFTFWFERLKDDRLKLTLELGPLEKDQRLALITQLENQDVTFSPQSKAPTSKYTRLYSRSVIIDDWQNEELIFQEMKSLFLDPKNQVLLEKIHSLH